MFDQFRSLFRGVIVKEHGDEIIINGVSGKALIRDINKHWKTTKITTNFFNVVTGNRISFYKFFAPEFMYLLDGVTKYRSRFTSIKMINALKAGMLENTWLKQTEQAMPGRLNFKRLSNMVYTPEDYQMEYFKDYDTRLNKYNLKGDLVDAATGTGKAVKNTTRIKVPGGWKQMGDIEVGDIVTAWDGSPTKVTAVYPQGKLLTYTITFADGRTADACGDHLWRVYNADWARYSDGWRLVNTKELFCYMHMPSYHNRLFIQFCKSEDIEDISLPVDPYNLGVMLGDGHLGAYTVTVTKLDEQLFENFKVNLPNSLKLNRINEKTQSVVGTVTGKNCYVSELRVLGLLSKTALFKFIPDIYMNGSTAQRLALVQGLMDTDGTVDKSGSLSYSSSSYQLASRFKELIWSLGGAAHITPKYPTYSHKGEKLKGNVNYNVNIRFPTPSALFRLDRKRDKCNDSGQYKNDALRLRIEHVNLSTTEECTCISVDHPDKLFVMEDYIVTHNTYITTAIAEMLESELIVVICPKETLELVWIPSIEEMYKTKQTVWSSEKIRPYNGERFIICHYNALDKLSNLLLDPKVYKGKKVTTILDESHNMNTIDSARTRMYLDIVKTLNSDNNMLASGTAVKALGVELLPLLRVVDPSFTSKVEERFRKAYGASASKGLDIIRFRLGLISFKIEKKVLEMEPPIVKVYPVKIPNGDMYTLPEIKKDMIKFISERFDYYKARRAADDKFWQKCMELHQSKLKTKVEFAEFKHYLSLVRMISGNPGAMDIGEEIKQTNVYEKMKIEPTLPRDMIKGFRDVKSIIKYTHLKIQGECLGRVLGGKRISCHVDMVPHIDWVGMVESTSKKTVVFTSFVEALEATQKHVLSIGLQPLTVYGKNKNEMVDSVGKFDKDPKLNPMLATYQSLSTGVRLTVADTVILLNTPFRRYILEQAVARAYRKGQDSQVVVYKTVLDTGDVPNISTRSDDILRWSTEQVAAILGLSDTYTEGSMVDSFEDFKYDLPLKDIPDENELMHGQLERMFAPFEIEISKEEFRTPSKERIKSIPFYLQ